ncbi:TetR/AcrR family transcriptional regulator [Streptomyces sp. NBC_01497]|uniref:TetR/AcrR family transcriptional regulator n=1 Tax=Streptomyces sp. NBC_01497 TaxID=2903885 RepID=UPI002E3247B0|nr:TetR/AcrR family transcriptional regulator [Streptomyces sp. NBC_01497]
MTAEPRGNYAKGRAKRLEIIEHAVTVFGEVGYRGASLRVIANRGGISHTGLLHHFPTKGSLLIAVLEHRDQVDDVWLTRDGATGVEQLRGLTELAELNTTRKAIVELFSVLAAEATSPEHPAHSYFVRRYENSVSSMALTYTLAREEGVLRAGVDPDTAAQQLVALMDGLQVQWLLSGCVTDMAGVLRAHIAAQLTVPF